VQAIAIWRRFPSQIAADLQRVYHRHIREWHEGVMSSREFLELLGELDDDSRYQRARCGFPYGVMDWSPQEYAMADLVRQATLARYDGAPAEAERPDLSGLLSPVQHAVKAAADAAEDAEYTAAYDRNMAEMEGRATRPDDDGW